jgi:hypothetical protein
LCEIELLLLPLPLLLLQIPRNFRSRIHDIWFVGGE